MAEIIELGGKNKLGYAHVVCQNCDNNNSFHIRTSDPDEGPPKFESIICTECGNEIFVDMTPVWEKR